MELLQSARQHLGKSEGNSCGLYSPRASGPGSGGSALEDGEAGNSDAS